MIPTTSNSYATSNNKRLLQSENDPSPKQQKTTSQQDQTTKVYKKLVAIDLNHDIDIPDEIDLSERIQKLEESVQRQEKTQKDILSKISTLISMADSRAKPTNPNPQSSERLAKPSSIGTQVFSMRGNANISPTNPSATIRSNPLIFLPTAKTSPAQVTVKTTQSQRNHPPAFLKMIVDATKDLIYDLPPKYKTLFPALDIYHLEKVGIKEYLKNNLLLSKCIFEQIFIKMQQENKLENFTLAFSYCEILKQLKDFDLLNLCTDFLEKMLSNYIKHCDIAKLLYNYKLLLTRVLIIKNDYVKAIELLKECGDEPLKDLLYAFCLIKLESFSEAKSLLETINNKNCSMLSLSLYGEVEYLLQNKARAEELFLRAYGIKPQVEEAAFYPKVFIEFVINLKKSKSVENQN